MVSQMVAVLPCCNNAVSPKPFSATLPLHSNPWNRLSHPALWQSTVYPPNPPVAVFAHYTHYKQFDSCCYICIFQQFKDDVNTLPLMTHLKHSVQWPRTSSNVNDAFKCKRASFGQREAHYSVKTLGLSFSLNALGSNIITPCDWLRWSH